MTEPQQNTPTAAPESVQQSAPETAQPASESVQQSVPEVATVPGDTSENAAQSETETYVEDKVEVGDIVVDSHNRPVLVLDVNNGEGGAVTGVAFNLDGTTEVVTERPE